MESTRERLYVSRIIRFVFIILLLCTVGAAPKSTQAAAEPLTGPGWVVVASQERVYDAVFGNVYYNAIYTINTYTNAVHGPFLMDELTPLDEDTGRPLGGDVLDVALTPDGKTALISSFDNKLIYFVDLTEARQPEYLASVKLNMFAEDIAITADGRYALVTDGGFSEIVYSIDIDARAVVEEFVMTVGYTEDDPPLPINGYANAVAVAPDGTVVVSGYYPAGAIHSLLLAEDGTLTHTAVHQYFLSVDGEVSLTAETGYESARPVNAAIAPDGITVLISDVHNYVDMSLPQYTNQYTVGVYKITAPGVLEFVEAITGLPHAMQTITFNEEGNTAVMLGNSAGTNDVADDPTFTPRYDELYLMDVLSPGVVAFTPGQSVALFRYTGAQYFGVDGLAVYEGKAYATYPINSLYGDPLPPRYVMVVDLNSLYLKSIYWGWGNTSFPIGVAVRPFIPYQYFTPLVSRR